MCYVVMDYVMLASDISRVAMSPLLLVATVLVVELAAAAVTDQPSQITDEELKSINKVNDLDTKWVTIICIGLKKAVHALSFQRVLPLRPLLPARGCRGAAHRPPLHLQRLLPRPRVSHAGGGAVRPVLPLHREYCVKAGAGGGDSEGRGSCVSLVSCLQWTKILKFIVYTNPSLVQERADQGVRLGDDICR